MSEHHDMACRCQGCRVRKGEVAQSREDRARELLDAVVHCADEGIHLSPTSPIVVMARAWCEQPNEGKMR